MTKLSGCTPGLGTNYLARARESGEKNLRLYTTYADHTTKGESRMDHDPFDPGCSCIGCQILQDVDPKCPRSFVFPDKTPQRRLPSPARQIFFQTTDELIEKLEERRTL